MEISRILSALKEGFFPKGITCNVCGKELSEQEKERSLCRKCAEGLVEIKNNPVLYGDTEVMSAFSYSGTARKYILFYKDTAKPYIAEYMARGMFERFAQAFLDVTEICYVPSSPSAIKRRGYDGMKYVAEELCRLTGKCLSQKLFRKDGADQTKVSYEERGNNVRDKFLSKGGFCGKVALIDDVVTSGATISECAKVISAHGADEVICVTYARAENKI